MAKSAAKLAGDLADLIGGLSSSRWRGGTGAAPIVVDAR